MIHSKSTIIDSHAHLSLESYQSDQDEVIKRAIHQHVIQIVHAGIDLKSIPAMIALAQKYPQIFLGFGVHPHEAKLWGKDSLVALRQALSHPRAVAIGECGLDFYYNLSDRQVQLDVFKKQVNLALELGKPLIIHTRDAWEETLSILEEVKDVHGVFHCYTGGPNVLPRVQALDFYVSFSGIVTFANAKNIQEAVPLVREDRLLVETDCPYLAPHPVRGKRNEPAFVWFVAQKLAELRNETVDKIAQITSDNARRLFGLPQIA